MSGESSVDSSEQSDNSQGIVNDVAISVENVSKTFKLPHERYASIKSLFINFYRRKKTYELQEALNDVSFQIKKGEFFGIVGRNGSGKSTLLKLIAGIYTPTKGKIKINGSLTPFIELGVGFNKELTGRENVYLNGALLGFNRKQMNAMYKDIVEFAELEKFMDQKLKNYSSGMQVRLAFSIAIRAHADILLIDEVLAVGDAAFQQKCYDYFSELKHNKKTIILVSHSMQVVERYCDRGLLLENGQITKISSSDEISNMYEQMFLREAMQKMNETSRTTKATSGRNIEISKLSILQDGKETNELVGKNNIELIIDLECKEPMQIDLGVNIKDRDKNMLISASTETLRGKIKLSKGSKKTIFFTIENILKDGLYTVNIGIADTSGIFPKPLLKSERASEFTIKNASTRGLVNPSIKVSIE
jgi:ABC-2 type transport system ATP-binding protein